VPYDVKTLLQKFPSILRTEDVKPTPNHEVEHHIHTGSHPPVFAKSRRLDPEKLQIAKVEFKRLESAGIVTMGFSFAHGTQKRRIVAALWQLSPFKFGNNPGQVSFAKHANLSNGLHVAQFFQKFILSRVITKSLLRPRTS
jgi:hypothetical protein